MSDRSFNACHYKSNCGPCSLIKMLEIRKSICKINQMTDLLLNTRKEDASYAISSEEGLKQGLDYDLRIARLQDDQNNEMAKIRYQSKMRIINLEKDNAMHLLNTELAHSRATKDILTEKIAKQMESSNKRIDAVSKWNTENNLGKCDEKISPCKCKSKCNKHFF